jgi:hypothetical protein
MKKFLGLAIIACMLFMLTSNAFANSSGQFYLDYSVNGSLVLDSTSNNSSTHDAKPLYIGADYWFDRFKIGAEYETANAKYHNTDVNSLLLKAGYSIFATDTFQFIISGGYGSYTINSNDIHTKNEVTSVIMAYELSQQFKHSNLDTLILFPIHSDYSLNGTKDSSMDSALFQGKIKYTYYLTEQLGLSIGYHLEGFVLGDNNNTDTYGNVTKGFTVGATYLF